MGLLRWKKWKAALWICGVLVLVAGGGAIIYRRGHTHRIYLRWKAEGIAASQAGNHVLAVYDLRSYLSACIDDQEALRAYIHSRPLVNVPGDRAAAADDTIFALRRLIALEKDALTDRRSLIQLYRSAGQDTEALDAADELLSLAPDDKEALAARSASLTKLKKWDDALAAARKWCEADPANVEPQMAVLACMHELLMPLPDLVNHVTALRKGPADARAAFLTSYALSLEDSKEAATDGKNAAAWFREAAGAELPSDAKLAGALAEQFDRLGLYDDSLDLLRRADTAGAGPPIRHQLLRRLWELNAWPEIASRCKSRPELSDSAIAGTFAVALIRIGEQPEASRIRKLLSDRRDDLVAAAWVEILDNAAGGGNLQQLIARCSAALAADPNDGPLHFICANAHLAMGDTLRAVQEMNNAAASSPSWPLPLARAAEVRLRRGEIDAALSAAQEALRLASHDNVVRDASVAVTAARVVFAAKNAGRSVNVEALTRLVATVQQAVPGEPGTLEIQAALFARAGRTEEARASLGRLIASPQASDERNLLRFAALSRSEHLGLENDCYQRSEREHGLTATLAFERAAALLGQGDRAGASKLLDDLRVKAADPNHAAWRIAICSFLELSGDPSAVAAWIKLGDLMPDDLAVQRAVFHSPACAADRAFDDRTLQRLRKLSGDAAPEWRIAHARALLTDPKSSPEQLNEVRDIVQDVLRNDPASAEAHWLYGGLLEKQNDVLGAVREFRAAADLDPTSPRFALELIPLLTTPAEIAELKQRLQCVADGPGASASALMQLAWLYEKSENRDSAEACYRRALVLQPDLPPAQNNLAMLLLRTRRPQAVQEAVTLATAATKLRPQIASFYDTLARAYEACGKLPEAIESISKAIALSPDNLDFRLSQIEWMIESGRLDAAKASLQAVDASETDTSGINQSLRSRLTLVRKQLE